MADFNDFGVNFYVFLCAESVRRAIKKSNILKIQDGHQNHLLKPEVLIGMVVLC